MNIVTDGGVNMALVEFWNWGHWGGAGQGEAAGGVMNLTLL